MRDRLRFGSGRHRGDRRARREGAALVIVMIFGVGALTLVLTLLSLGQAGAKVESERHQDKALHAVARYGAAMAINEVNRERLTPISYDDPTGNGDGCILFDNGTGGDGLEGWRVRTADGKLLGRFRAMVRTEVDGATTRNILSVVAAWPELLTDMNEVRSRVQKGQMRLAAVEVEIRRGRPYFDRNAFSVRGDADAGSSPGVYGRSNQVNIRGNGVPAVNISDLSTYNTFLGNLNQFGTVSGLDPDTSSAAVDEADTVTNDDTGLLDEEVLTEIADGIDGRVTTILGSGTEITAAQASSGATLPGGTYFIDDDVTIGNGNTLSGSGTLVITESVEIVGTLDWDGTVIVANSHDAKVEVKGRLNVTGVLAIQGIGDEADMGVTVRNGGRLTVDGPGAFTILTSPKSDGHEKTLFNYESGARIDVDGIFSVLGSGIDMDFDTGAEVAVTGSMAIVTPTNATQGVDIRFRPGAQMELNFNGDNFDGAVNALGAFFDPDGTILPVSIPGYVERGAITVLEQQETTLSANRNGSYGF